MNEHTHPQAAGASARGGHHHDWHDAHYVSQWIGNDVTKDDERRPIIREMLAHAPFPADASLHVLDVGGGYGILTDEVLKAFPNAHVTLQDYSDAMLEQARERLSGHASRVSYVQRDFSQSGWTSGIGGLFDLAVSGIAIHNLGEEDPMRQVYASVFSVLKPGGVFLDLDYVFRGGVEGHVEWLKTAGFSSVDCARQDDSRAMIVASRSSE